MKRWTKEEEEDLIFAVKEGLTYKEIAEIFGRTRESIKHKCKKLNISSNLANIVFTHKQYEKELSLRCSNIIVLGQYKNCTTPLLHKCLICNTEFKCQPQSKLKGYGCKTCSNLRTKYGSGINPNKPGITYLVHIPEYDIDNKEFIKLGITGNTIKQRFTDNKLNPTRYEVILERYFHLGSDAMKLEKEWKINVGDYLVNLGILKAGNTETFLY